MVSAKTLEYDPEIIEALGLPEHLFHKLQQPGERQHAPSRRRRDERHHQLRLDEIEYDECDCGHQAEAKALEAPLRGQRLQLVLELAAAADRLSHLAKHFRERPSGLGCKADRASQKANVLAGHAFGQAVKRLRKIGAGMVFVKQHLQFLAHRTLRPRGDAIQRLGKRHARL